MDGITYLFEWLNFVVNLCGNSLYNYFIENKLFTDCKSGYVSNDSCVSQPLSITHEIYESFDYNRSFDIRGVFLDISYRRLIFKLQTYGIDGKLLKLLESYVKDRQQRVLLNGQTSSWKKILAGVPQESVFRTLLFLIYINYLPDGLTSLSKIFADDTSLSPKEINKKKSGIEPINDLKLISQLTYQWKMLFNSDPTK